MAKKFNDTEYRLLLDILPTPLLHIKQLPKLLTPVAPTKNRVILKFESFSGIGLLQF